MYNEKGSFLPIVFFHSRGVLQQWCHSRSLHSVFSPRLRCYTCSVQIHNGKILCVIIIQTTAITPSAGWTLVDPFLCFLLKAGRPLLSPATRIHMHCLILKKKKKNVIVVKRKNHHHASPYTRNFRMSP